MANHNMTRVAMKCRQYRRQFSWKLRHVRSQLMCAILNLNLYARRIENRYVKQNAKRTNKTEEIQYTTTQARIIVLIEINININKM